MKNIEINNNILNKAEQILLDKKLELFRLSLFII